VFLDVDRFHALNRARGDAAGDDALRQVAAVLAAGCGEHDGLFRKGGDEFVALLVDTDLPEALRAAELLRAAVDASRIRHGAGRRLVTVSAGVAVLDPSRHATAGAVVAEAAEAMALAKRGGRNRVGSLR
jgi:diguanylate cyclase (GGDEF)-like protein